MSINGAEPDRLAWRAVGFRGLLQVGTGEHVAVQHTGADEWYTLACSPTTVPDDGLEDFHGAVLAAVERGGEAEVPREILGLRQHPGTIVV